jgi:hypothetical protein
MSHDTTDPERDPDGRADEVPLDRLGIDLPRQGHRRVVLVVGKGMVPIIC